VIPNIIAFDPVRRKRAELVPITGLAYVGSVERRKGIDVLVDVVAELSHLVQRIRVEVIGSIGMVGNVRADEYIQAAFSSAPHVTFKIHGAMPLRELWPYIARNKLLLVTPSLLENQPTTLMYASLHGIPVLSYDVGGVADMLLPQSQPLTLLQCSRSELKTRIEAALVKKQAFVPVLHGVMHTSKRRWVRFVRRAVKLAEREERAAAVSGQHVRHGDAATGGRSYTLLRLSSGFNTGMVTSTLARKGTDHATVLIIQPGYHVAGHAAGVRMEVLAAQLEASPAAGVVAYVEMSDRSVLYPEPPYFLPSSAWQACGPEAPVPVEARVPGRIPGCVPGHAVPPLAVHALAAEQGPGRAAAGGGAHPRGAVHLPRLPGRAGLLLVQRKGVASRGAAG
jgi:hypothetical protein